MADKIHAANKTSKQKLQANLSHTTTDTKPEEPLTVSDDVGVVIDRRGFQTTLAAENPGSDLGEVVSRESFRNMISDVRGIASAHQTGR